MNTFAKILRLGCISIWVSLFSGCQWDTARVLELRVVRIEEGATEGRGLMPEQAVQLHREFAEELGQTVKGSGYKGGVWVGGSSEPKDRERLGEATISLFIDSETISFVVNKYGTKEEFQEAKKVGELIAARLDQLKIPYKTEYRAAWFWGP